MAIGARQVFVAFSTNGMACAPPAMPMTSLLVLLVVAFPVLAALGCAVLPGRSARTAVVLATGAGLAAGSIGLLVVGSGGAVSVAPLGGVSLDTVVTVADFALLGIMFAYAIALRSAIVGLLVVLQAGPLAWFEATMLDHSAEVPAFAIDNLALVMVLVVSIVGSLVIAFALPYMDEHEQHLHLPHTRQPRFFFFMTLFLGAMNGLVLSNNLLYLYFFFEVTTFCSFMLIGHDGTKEARRSAHRALWMNSLGGVAFVAGIFGTYGVERTLDLQKVLSHGAGGALLVPVAALCFAGFTKAAQVPMQSWLLGAMVAPTPVSALLHSSTMVKAGVYVVLRLAPAFAGTSLGTGIAMYGAFTFCVTAALAVGQSNGKKILAYSTISNLGLIIACAGLSTALSLTAGLLLIVFHAISKGLLFLTVGSIEQRIGSRDIEDMWGLYARMPRTTAVAVIGIVSMMAPPFGVLMSKWIAIESASGVPVVVVLLALGSALSVLVYTRWAGMLLSTPAMSSRPTAETQATLSKVALYSLAAGALVLPATLPLILDRVTRPMYAATSHLEDLGMSVGRGSGALAFIPFYVVIAAGIGLTFVMSRCATRIRFSAPYMSGVPGDLQATTFVGPMNEKVRVVASNYYLSSVFGEGRLTTWVNAVAFVLLAVAAVGAVR
jgi:ech hydrogenase subunit A